MFIVSCTDFLIDCCYQPLSCRQTSLLTAVMSNSLVGRLPYLTVVMSHSLVDRLPY